MPQSARILTTACPNPAVSLEDCQREYGRVTCSTSPQKSRYMGPLSFTPSCMVQRPGFSIGSRSGYLSGFTNSTCTLSLVSKARLRVERRSPQESQPAQHRVHLASGAAALGYPRHKDGRRVHAKSSLLQRDPRRKGRSWCSRKCYKDQLKRQLAWVGISHQSWQQKASDRDSWRSSVRKASCEFEAERHKAAKEKRRRQKE